MRRIWSILLALLILAAPVRAAEDEKWVALTFDDGPSGALTERLLDGLAARDVKATFFVCGYRVAEYPAALRRIAAEGHEIGLHSEKHDYMQKMDYEAVLDDLTRCRAEVAECCGTQARLFRPPGGLYSETVLRASSKLDLSLILWSVDPEDWDAKKAASVLPTIRKEVFPGSVILMHDLHESSVDAALTAIDELRAQGYTLQLQVCIPAETGIRNADMVVAFGNLLDNAAEACRDAGEKRLSLSARMDRGFLCIEVRNPAPAAPARHSRRIPELERGIGSHILRALAETYEGSYALTPSGGECTASLLLKGAAA